MSNIITQLYKSRNILLNLLEIQGYEVEDYKNFSLNEIRIMYTNKQLDMLITNPLTHKKMFVKYHLSNKLQVKYIYDYIEDLYYIEEILTPNDDFTIITKNKINDTLTNIMKNLYLKDKIYLNIFNLKQLQFNILEHTLVPPHDILSDTRVEEIKKNIILPIIHNFQKYPDLTQ